MMAERQQFGVIGLGKFGYYLGKTLVELGHDVLGIDSSADKVKHAQESLTQVYQADATDKTAVEQLDLASLPQVVISVGHSMEASILICMHLKELGAPQVWVKAMSAEHERVLYKIGADHVVFPERFAAHQLARRITVPGLVDYLPFGKDIVIKELVVDKWSGKSLRELALSGKYGIQVLGIKNAGSSDFSFGPKADIALSIGDVLIVMGHEKSFYGLTA